MRRIAVGHEQDDHAGQPDGQQRDGDPDDGKENLMNDLFHDGTSLNGLDAMGKSEARANSGTSAGACFAPRCVERRHRPEDARGNLRGGRGIARAGNISRRRGAVARERIWI